jgi:hypothetical protein
MRYMMIVKSDQETESGTMPDKEIFAEMRKFNEALMQAGCLLAAEGFYPTSKGFRVRIANGERDLRYGPFPGSREQIAGFWLIRVASRAEAIDWAAKCPVVKMGGELELREIMELEDLPADIRATEELQKELRMRDVLEHRVAHA